MRQRPLATLPCRTRREGAVGTHLSPVQIGFAEETLLAACGALPTCRVADGSEPGDP